MNVANRCDVIARPMRSRLRVVLRQLLLSACVACGAAWLAGCPAPPAAPKDPLALDGAVGPAPVVGSDPVSSGTYVPVPRVVLTDAALTRAKMERAAVAAEVRKAVASAPASGPATSPAAATTAPSGRNPSAEPPPLAIKYYLQGREKFLEGANSEAMDFLDKALGLDPEAFTVLRLMGRVCFASNQLARGNYYLQRAHMLQPLDVEVDYLLGRYYLEGHDWPQAIRYLLDADESPERVASTAQAPLVVFHLARALQGGGYYRAAAKEYENFLRMVSDPLAAYRYDRDLSYLLDEQWAVDLSAAECFAAAGDYARALSYYEASAKESPKETFIASRLINAEAHVGKGREATAQALQLLTDTGASDDAMALLVWTYRATGHEAQMLPDLRKQLQTVSDRSAAVRALANVLDKVGKPADATAALEQQVRDDPSDTATLEVLLARFKKSGDYQRALADTGLALQKAPADKQEEIAQLFQPMLNLRPNAGADATANSNPYCMYLDTLALAQSGLASNAAPQQLDASVRDRLAEVVRQAPDFFLARQAYIDSLLAAEQFKQADEFIEQALATKQGGARAVQLHVESEVAQYRYSKALKIAKEGKAAFPRSTEMRMAIVGIYRLRGQDRDADAELLATIEEFPKYESAYHRLIDSYILRGREEGQSDRYLGEAVALLGRLVRELPASRYAQTVTALLYARTGQLQKAEEQFQRLLDEDPTDPDVVVPLAQVRDAQGHADQALEVLNAALKIRATPEVVATIAEIQRDQGHNDKALEVSAKLMQDQPAVEAWLILQAGELMSQARHGDAIKLLATGVTKFPHSQQMATAYVRALLSDEHGAEAVKAFQEFIARNGANADRLYFLAGIESSAKQDAAAESTLQQVLVIIPDHSGANNDLGYFWVDSGRHLAESTAMIRKALTNQPYNPAFLDSLGWAYYKQAKFKDAIDTLTQAVAQPGGMDPELLSHLGDALYRGGKPNEAVERWTLAQSMISGQPKTNPRLKEHLEHVLDQTRRGKSPELAPMGAGVKVEQEL